MPKARREKPIYQRGQYGLYPRAGRNLEIIWYDAERKRERSVSTGTSDVGQGKLALDRLYLSQRCCPTCNRPWDDDESPLLASVIADYLVLSEGKAGHASARFRLAHVTDYLAATDAATRCGAVDERWINAFRKWLLARPVVSGNGKVLRKRALGSVEGSVMQLAAAINSTPSQRALFKAEQAKTVARSPTYRADIKTLAAMFRFAMSEPHRINLLRYLRLGVATWARPDAIIEATREQWFPHASVFDLNPPGRRQTKKHRPRVPIPRQFAPLLDGDAYIPVSTIRAPWEKMRTEIGLPDGGEAGIKLIRRSMATLARKRIGEANWRQGEMMLGHVKASVSDIYALPDPANLGLALAATEAIIDEIEVLAPGAFRRAGAALRVVG
jgi:hypothetical protein